MEALFHASPSSGSWLLPRHGKHEALAIMPSGFLTYSSTSKLRITGGQGFTLPKNSVKVEARKSRTKMNKGNAHSFSPQADEATGPFPEAILLKQKIMKEDGRILPEFADADEEQLFEFLNLELQSNLKVDRMRHYEVVYMIHEKNEAEVGSVNEKVQDFIREKKGKLWRVNDWGMRRLAYQIKKANFANYILMNFELEAKCINDFKTMLDKDERIIRHLVIKRDEAITEDCPSPPDFYTLRGEDDFEDDDEDYEFDDEDEDEDEDEVYEEEADEEAILEDNIIYVPDDETDNFNRNTNRALRTGRNR